MANYNGGATTICPYYEKEAALSITCTGAIENSLQMNRFNSKDAKERWQALVCSTYSYNRCPIAKLHEENYDNKDKKQERLRLEPTEQNIYDFIVSFTQDNLYPPSIREICTNTHYASTKTVKIKLEELQEIGLIEIDNNKSRAIKLVGYEIIKK